MKTNLPPETIEELRRKIQDRRIKMELHLATKERKKKTSKRQKKAMPNKREKKEKELDFNLDELIFG